MTQATDISEAELVARSAAGDRDAFADLVRRYQSLVCAVAYNGTGNLSQSEDLSQEIFVTAWRKLAELREREKFRPWLCGIARNLVSNARRYSSRHRVSRLDDEEGADAVACSEVAPVEQAITREEEAILWRALERIPETYREPMILYYRQEHSVDKVAEALELSEDAVKQRLSRGRKLLQEELAAFVEGALARSNPRPEFVASVTAALPVMTIGAKATALSVTAAKSGTTVAGAGVLAVVSAALTPFLTVVGFWSSYRVGIAISRSDAERAMIKGFYRRLLGCMAALGIGVFLLMIFGRTMAADSPRLFTSLVIVVAAMYVAAMAWLMVWVRQRRAGLRKVAVLEPVLFPNSELRSRSEFLGIPLFHMQRGSAHQAPAKGWIAIGNDARGILFAYGGAARALIAVGGRASGIIAFGGLATGVFSLGGFSIGIWSLGGMAIGWEAFGGVALAWRAAAGAIAVAHTYAVGTLVAAANSNNSGADTHIGADWMFRTGQVIFEYGVLFNLFWIAPLILWWRAARRRNAGAKSST